jgi:hypothetical protein
MRYCPSWAAPRKKGRPKKEVRKLGISDHVQKGVLQRRRHNPVVTEKIVEEVHEDDAGIEQYGELKLEETKDRVIGNA